MVKSFAKHVSYTFLKCSNHCHSIIMSNTNVSKERSPSILHTIIFFPTPPPKKKRQTKNKKTTTTTKTTKQEPLLKSPALPTTPDSYETKIDPSLCV